MLHSTSMKACVTSFERDKGSVSLTLHPVPDCWKLWSMCLCCSKRRNPWSYQVAANEWGPDGINANIICPLTWTAQLENFQQAYPEALKLMLKCLPAGHYGMLKRNRKSMRSLVSRPISKYEQVNTYLRRWNGIKAVTRPAEDRMYFLPLASFISVRKNAETFV